jgi:alpha-D-glucose phosphate-specific phosphoglucomutase
MRCSSPAGQRSETNSPRAGAARRDDTSARLSYAYINDLGNVIDLDVIRSAKIHLGVDPLGGAGVHYWARIAEQHGLNLTVVDETVDPTFRFMTVDWDGQIRMDPSSPYAMQRLIGMKDRFDLSFACDTDHDRHGIVTKSDGLLPPNHDLCAAIFYLFQNRPKWSKTAAVGKTIVSSQMIDRITAKLGRKLFRGAGWFQVVRGWLARWLAGICRRGERRFGFPSSGWHRLDDGQGRHSFPVCSPRR